MDEKWNIKISDFGITSLLKDEQDSDASLIGTIAYIAPEVFLFLSFLPSFSLFSFLISYFQLLVGEPICERTDIYSFGFVLWEMFHYG